MDYYCLVAISLLIGVMAVVLHRRSKNVLRFRLNLVERIIELSRADKIPSNIRYETMASVSYETMVWYFWVPLKVERWYSDTSFLEP